jgi:hypothetical protein
VRRTAVQPAVNVITTWVMIALLVGISTKLRWFGPNRKRHSALGGAIGGTAGVAAGTCARRRYISPTRPGRRALPGRVVALLLLQMQQ